MSWLSLGNGDQLGANVSITRTPPTPGFPPAADHGVKEGPTATGKRGEVRDEDLVDVGPLVGGWGLTGLRQLRIVLGRRVIVAVSGDGLGGVVNWQPVFPGGLCGTNRRRQ